jgi:hypothetical protein
MEKKGLNVLDEFWRQWSSEYLLGLRQRMTYDHQKRRSSTLEPKVGHVVLVKDTLLPRGAWRMAKIVELKPSSDGKVRSAIVRLSKTGRLVGRPVNLLCPFELGDGNCRDSTITDGELRNTNLGDKMSDSPDTIQVRPHREAAIRARDILKANQWMFG